MFLIHHGRTAWVMFLIRTHTTDVGFVDGALVTKRTDNAGLQVISSGAASMWTAVWRLDSISFTTPKLTFRIGEISFFRNGVPLGIAFRGVRSGVGMAYFPAASVSALQACVFNFGALPFEYPVTGFAPLHAAPPVALVARCSYLLDCLTRLVDSTLRSAPAAEVLSFALSCCLALRLTGMCRRCRTMRFW
jgi:hypothetical protein